MSRLSPLAAVCGGVAAGLVACLAQDLFFALTKRLAPATGTDAFQPPELEPTNEPPTQIVARRIDERLARRGPLLHEERAGRVVHYAFGSVWGGVYGVVAAGFPSAMTLKGGLAFGFALWASSDDVLLPWFELAAWPHHYPVKTRLYGMAAHAVYGAALSSCFAGLVRSSTPAAALLGSLYLTRNVPKLVRPSAQRLVRRGLRVAIPVWRFAA